MGAGGAVLSGWLGGMVWGTVQVVFCGQFYKRKIAGSSGVVWEASPWVSQVRPLQSWPIGSLALQALLVRP